MMVKLLYLTVLGALWMTVCCQKDLVRIPEVPAQVEALSPGEEELKDAATVDKQFDDSILSREGRPPSLPDQRKTEVLFREQQQQQQQQHQPLIEDGATGKTELVNVNLYVKYYLYSDWYQIYYRCCPRAQNYGCRSYRRPLPCHSHYVNGVREWCCPFSPGYPRLYIANCNCSECAVFTSTCVRKGTCQRRYSWRYYYAICYRNNYWGIVRRMRRRLPTSCYCRAR